MSGKSVVRSLSTIGGTMLILCAIQIVAYSQERGGSAERSAEAAAATWLIPHEAWNCRMAEGIPTPEAGLLVFEAELKLDAIYDVGKTQYGQRSAYVVQEGTLTGEKIKGTIMPLGLDFALTLENGVVEIEQFLVIQTDDRTRIFLRNAGVGPNAEDVRIVFDFEAPNASQYTWLHAGKYVGRRSIDLAAKTMKLRVYDVSEAKFDANRDASLKIAKPKDVPMQSWELRTADASERQGDVIVVENVTLGGSVSIGQTKKGSRNIIPITGGELTGKITGKVLPGGADYQNFGGGAAIDARYLWQTSNGEVVVVRNGGSGRLVPTFEARTDGDYAWLNTGKFLSSAPGLGAGGVKLTFYESK